MDQRSCASGAGWLSTGSPRRLNTRPRQASPTGTVIGPPVSTAFVPRTRPSVEFMAIHLTTSSPICCATSAVSFAPFDSISMALRRAGSSSCAKRISRTGPMTCTTSPMCFSLMYGCAGAGSLRQLKNNIKIKAGTHPEKPEMRACFVMLLQLHYCGKTSCDVPNI